MQPNTSARGSAHYYIPVSISEQNGETGVLTVQTQDSYKIESSISESLHLQPPINSLRYYWLPPF